MSLLIGVCGGRGSGKTTFAKSLCHFFGERAMMLSSDNYYKSNDDLTYEQRVKVNYDHPDSVDFDLMQQDLLRLKQGKNISLPLYDFTVHLRAGYTDVLPKDIIFVDGILLFCLPQIADMFDVKVFVDEPEEIRLQRRLRRDMHERGRSRESVLEQFRTTVQPMHEIYIQPYAKVADYISQGGKDAATQNAVKQRILTLLQNET